MKKSLRRYLLAAATALSATLSIAADEPPMEGQSSLVISSGIQGGGYWKAATRLQTVADDLGFEVKVTSSYGSLENLDRLVDPASPVNLAFAQADALQFFMDRNPEASEGIDILESIGQECVFVITSNGADVRDDMAMQAADGYRLGIASANSGVAITFNYMSSQVPELKDVKVSYGDTGAAMAQLQNTDAEVDAVMLVHRPKEHSPEVKRALQEPENFDFVEISDSRLIRELPNGDRVYHTMNLAMSANENSKKTPVKTICVKGLLLANKQKLSSTQRDQLSDLVVMHWMRVFVTQ